MTASSSSKSKSGTVLAVGKGTSAKAASSSADSSSYSSDNQNNRNGTPAKLSGLRFDNRMFAIGRYAIEIVSFKGWFKGAVGDDRRGGAGHPRIPYAARQRLAPLNRGFRLCRKFDQRLARFEDSVLGMAIGALVPFAMMIGMLHFAGGQ